MVFLLELIYKLYLASYRFYLAFWGTRYLISTILGAIVLVYSGLWIFGLVPDYAVVARFLTITPQTMLFLLYVVVALAVGTAWIHSASGLRKSVDERPHFRWLVRHTDRAGVRWFSAGLLLATLALNHWLQKIVVSARDVIAFLTTLAVIPLAFDLLPAVPRRLVIGDRLITMHDVREFLEADLDELTTSEAASDKKLTTSEAKLNAIRQYNRFDRLAQLYRDSEDLQAALEDPTKPLPPGMILELPPLDLEKIDALAE